MFVQDNSYDATVTKFNVCVISGDKPMTFSGKSYAKWTLQDAFTIEQRLTLSLRIKTRKQLATIMYAKGKVDYSILEVKKITCLICSSD